MDALAEGQHVLVDGDGLTGVGVGAEPLVAGKVSDANVVFPALNHEDGVGAGAFSVGLGLRLPVPHEDINGLP